MSSSFLQPQCEGRLSWRSLPYIKPCPLCRQLTHSGQVDLQLDCVLVTKPEQPKGKHHVARGTHSVRHVSFTPSPRNFVSGAWLAQIVCLQARRDGGVFPLARLARCSGLSDDTR